jgi:hypothetical protein
MPTRRTSLRMTSDALEASSLPRWLWIAAACVGLALFGLGLVLAAMPFVFPAALDAFGVIIAG